MKKHQYMEILALVAKKLQDYSEMTFLDLEENGYYEHIETLMELLQDCYEDSNGLK
jgi:hypothetical protein